MATHRKIRLKSFMLLLAFAALITSGCGGGGKNKVLARIDKDQTITLDEFQEIISKLPERYQDVVTKNKKEFLDELIIDRLLYKEGLKKRLDKDKDVQKLFNEAKRKIIMARLLQDEVENKVKITEEEIEEYYTTHKERFTTPETLRASHILTKTRKEANDVLVELSNGRSFEELARARSIDPTAEIGGDIGYFTKNQLVPEFEDVCFRMRVGEISGVVKTKFGYHIIKLTERQKPRIKDLAEVRDVIKQSLRRIKKKIRFNEFVKRLKEQSQITINDDLLERISKDTSTLEVSKK